MFAKRTRLLLRCVLVLSLIKAIRSRPQQQQLRRVCYFTNWSCDLLVKEAYFCLHDLDPSLCSHLIFAFAGVNVTSLSLSPTRADDESVGHVKGRYVKFNDIKKNNPDLKTLLSAGGSYQGEKFKMVTSTNTSRERFAYNTARYVRRWGFDGLDLDWEYPGRLEKESLTELVKDLKAAFREEAARTGQKELLLSIAVPVGEERVRLGYQVDLISKEADMINLMAYDFYYGAWSITAFNSPLYARNHPSFSRKHSVEWIVNLWINLGAAPQKINLGVAGYGQSFTLQVDLHETLHSELQAAGNRTGTELDETNNNRTAALRNTSTDNNTSTTFHNNILDSVNVNIQSLQSTDNYVRKKVPTCDVNLDDCVMEDHSFQNIREKRDGHGIFSHDVPATSSSGDDIITNTESNQAGLSGVSIDKINIHKNGIGSQELDSKEVEGLDADRKMLSRGEFLTHIEGNNKHRHQDSAPNADVSQRRDTTAGISGGSGKPRHGADTVLYGVGSKAVGPGRPGRLRHLKGQLSYPEICERIQAGADVAWDSEQRVPYAVLGDQWVGYENTRSVAEKVTWAFQQQLGGVMFWSLDLDDFKGDYCGQGRFPLLTSMSNTVISLVRHQNRSMTRNITHYTQTHRAKGANTQESRATNDSDNNMDNATKRPLTTVTLSSHQIKSTHQTATKTPHWSRQNEHEHRSVASYRNTTDSPSDFEATDITHLTNRHTIDFHTPTNIRDISDKTPSQMPNNTANETSGKNNASRTTRFQSHGRNQSKQSNLLPSDDKTSPAPTDFVPSTKRKKSEPNDFVPLNERKPLEPRGSIPSTERKQLGPPDLLPANERKYSDPSDFLPSNERKQREPTNFSHTNETTDVIPSDKSNQFEPTDLFASDVREESEINNNYYDYNTDSQPLTTTVATTTARKTQINKQNKSHSKTKTKKRYLRRNSSNSLTASVSAIVFAISLRVFTRVYS
ncbi:hypothetical protein BsWGS_18586 [Bradybaena similaris]